MDKEKIEYEPGDIDYDYVVPLKVKKTYKIKAYIKSFKKHSPRIFFD